MTLKELKNNFDYMYKIQNDVILEDSPEKNYLFREYLKSLLKGNQITDKEWEEYQYTFHPHPELACQPMTPEDEQQLENIIKQFKRK
jgi:hypothetical protein